MKKKIFFLFLFLLGIAAGSRAQTAHVLSDSTTTLRPSDLIGHDIRWNRASTDDFTYWIDSGFYGFYGPQPTILVDGLPMDANFFGWQNLNILPIQNSERITYSPVPQMHGGELSPAGYINFHTSRIDTGFSVNASYYIGNETGDPGPYNYDSTKVTPNIDRWGPDGSIEMSFMRAGWYAKGDYTFRNHKPTDLALNSRLHFTASQLGTNQSYKNHLIHQDTHSGLVESGYKGERFQFRARAASGVSNDYLFLQPYGKEIPARTRYRQIAVESAYKTGHWLFKGQYIGLQKKIGKRYDIHPYIFDWDQRKHTVNFSIGYHTALVNLKPGISYERLITKAPGLGSIPHDLTNFYLKTVLHPTPRDSIRARLNVDYDERHVAQTWSVHYMHQMVPGWKVTPSVTHAEVLPLRQNSFSYWVNHGYTFAHFLNIPYSPSLKVDKNSLTSYEFESDINVGPHLTFKLDPRLIHHLAINIPYQKVKENEFLTDTNPGTFQETSESGTRLQLFGELTYHLNNVLEQSLAVNLQRTASGSKRYKSYFKQIPETKIQYQIKIKPVPDLCLSSQILYRTSTVWNEFSAIEGNRYHLPNGIPIRKVEGTFHQKTPAFTNISIGIKKWFLRRHLNAQVSIQNLLDQNLRYHPLGANLSTKFDLKVNVDI